MKPFPRARATHGLNKGEILVPAYGDAEVCTDPAATPAQNRDHMCRRLARGFLVLIVLMVVLAGHAVWHISDLKDRMRDIVEVRNRKIQLATDLQEASYNRHNNLVYQTLARDPFERDTNFQLYIKWGYQVGKARNAIKALPLDTFEHENLARQDRLVTQIIDVQEAVSDLAAREELDAARERLATSLRPLNLQYTETVENLRRYERDRIRSALEEAQGAARSATTLHLILGGMVVSLAIVISLVTNRLLRRSADTIYRQMATLEKTGTQLEHEATHDPLTGLANRALFHQRLHEAMLHARQEKFPLVVMYVDLDDFKEVNDIHGHAAGDALLRVVADRLRRTVRVSDTVARLGGDEFAIILMGLDKPEDCPTLRDKIEREVSQPVALDRVTLTLRCSIGHALFPGDGTHPEELLRAADARMYEVKRARKLARADGQR